MKERGTFRFECRKCDNWFEVVPECTVFEQTFYYCGICGGKRKKMCLFLKIDCVFIQRIEYYQKLMRH